MVSLGRYVGAEIVKYDAKELAEIKDEANVWMLLNRHLDFEAHIYDKTQECLTDTLNSLTEVDLEQVSRLEYNGDSDLFEEINGLVNDPNKARLLDGLKRASKNHDEMTHMLVSLRRWLKRSSEEIREAIYSQCL